MGDPPPQSVKELRARLRALGVEHSGCVEKHELRALLAAATCAAPDDAAATAARAATAAPAGPRGAAGLCHSCGLPASLLCGGCRTAAYCSVPCQRRAFAEHKTVCTMVATAPAVAAASFPFHIINSCLHGGPPMSREPELVLAISQLTVKLVNTGSDMAGNAQGLALLHEFCTAQPRLASHRGAPRVLVSCGIDALADNNIVTAQFYMSAAIFLEAFAAGHARFLAAVTAAPPLSAEPACARYLQLLERIASPAQLFAEMRGRIPCSCLSLTRSSA